MDDRSADRPVQQRSQHALQVRDLSEWATRVLAPSDPPGPTGGAASSGRQWLQGAGAYEQEAAKLQALAQRMEQDLWDCSEHLD